MALPCFLESLEFDGAIVVQLHLRIIEFTTGGLNFPIDKATIFDPKIVYIGHLPDDLFWI